MVSIPNPQPEQPTAQTRQQSNQQSQQPYYVGIDASEFMKELIANDHIPPEIVEGAGFWTAFGRSTKFSFLDYDDIEFLMLHFEILLIRFKQNIPKVYVTPKVLATLTNIKMEYYVNLCRARGNGTINERTLIATSASANFTERPIEKISTNNSNLLTRLANSINRR